MISLSRCLSEFSCWPLHHGGGGGGRQDEGKRGTDRAPLGAGGCLTSWQTFTLYLWPWRRRPRPTLARLEPLLRQLPSPPAPSHTGTSRCSRGLQLLTQPCRELHCTRRDQLQLERCSRVSASSAAHSFVLFVPARFSLLDAVPVSHLLAEPGGPGPVRITSAPLANGKMAARSGPRPKQGASRDGLFLLCRSLPTATN